MKTKKIGLFLSASPHAGGMFQYSLAMLSALQALPADEYQLVIAYSDEEWRLRAQERNGNGLHTDVPIKLVSIKLVPIKLGTLTRGLATLPSFLPASYERWGSTVTRFSGWADPLLEQECDLWVFPRQDVWSALFPLPVLASVHDLMHRYEPHFPETASYGRSRYRDGYLRAVCRRARGILVDSEMGKRQVQDSYGTAAERLFVLPYVAPAYLADAGRDMEFQRKYQLPEKYVFYPAQFWEHKNHIRLIRAIAEVRRDFPDIRLVLVGPSKNGIGAARREVEKLGLERHVSFAGYLPDKDMAGFYQAARALVLPTLFGPTNIPPLEAFSLGCPVALSGIYGGPEQVGDAALLFDPYSVESIAESIGRLWADDDLCRVLRAKGKKRAAAWGPAQFAGAVHGIIRQLSA